MKKKNIFLGVLVAGMVFSIAGCKKDKKKTEPENPTPPVTEQQTYTVTFDSKGGTAVAKATTNTDGKVAKPENPTKTDFDFGGWFTDSECQNAFDFDTKITQDTTLYAKWTAKTPSGGGSDTPSGGEGSQTPSDSDTKEKWKVEFYLSAENTETYTIIEDVEDNTTVTLPTEPMVTGKVFLGWKLESGEDFTAETKITANTKVIASFRDMTIYEKLVADEGHVLHEDFESYTATDSLETFDTTWQNKGIYTYTNNPEGATANYVGLGNGVATLVDTTDKATNMVVSLGEDRAIYGKVEGYFEMKFSGSGNSWTPVQFNGIYDDETSIKEFFGFRTDGGLIKFRLKGGSALSAETEIASNDTTTYKVHFIFDIENNTVTITINEQPYLTNYALYVEGDANRTIHLKAIVGYKFVSSDNGSKLITMDNVAIAKQDPDFNVFKEKTLSQINQTSESFATGYTYCASDIEAFLDNIKVEINAATTVAEIVEAISEISQLSQFLDDATIDTNVAEIENAITALPAVESSNAIILANGDDINSAYELYTNAKEVVKTRVNSDLVTKLTTLKEKLDYAIANPDYLDMVEAEVTSAKEELEEIYTVYDVATNYTTNGTELTQIKEQACEQLDGILTAARAESSVSQDSYNAYAIQINSIKEQAIEDMSEVLSDLDQAKIDKKDSIQQYYNDNLSNYSQEYNLEAFNTAYQALIESVDSATTVDEVNAITTESLENIRTDAEEIEYNNKPVTTLSELAPCTKSFDGKIHSGESKDTTITAGTKAGTDDFLTFTSVTKCKYSKSGYLSFNGGGTITFTTNSANAKITFVYTSTSTDRSFTITNSTSTFEQSYTPHNWSNKTMMITLDVADTYTITFDTMEHKIGSITLEDMEVQDVEYKVLSITAEITGSDFTTLLALKEAIQITLNLEGEKTKTLSGTDSSLVIQLFAESDTEFESPIEEESITATTYKVRITYTNLDKSISVVETVSMNPTE